MSTLLLAQSSADAVGTGVTVVAFVVGIAISVAIFAVVAWLMVNAYNTLPADAQLMEPGQIWLLLIPYFNAYWIFVVTAKVSDSFCGYLDRSGSTGHGDCGKQIGFALSICWAVSAVLGLLGWFVPFVSCVGSIAGLAGLVLLIVYLVKIYGLKNHVATTGGGAAPPPPAA